MYNEMVGVGVPMAMQRMVILDPSTTRFTGFTDGGWWTKMIKISINGRAVIEREL